MEIVDVVQKSFDFSFSSWVNFWAIIRQETSQLGRRELHQRPEQGSDFAATSPTTTATATAGSVTSFRPMHCLQPDGT